jgi:hypothetical protein
MSVPKIYENKEGQRVVTNDTFIYCSEIYMLWKGGASLLEEKYYSTNKPLKIKSKNLKVKKKNYTLFRYLTLEFAPEEYLLNNKFKLV